MRPSVTVLQLDTHFPRVAGDVGAAATYLNEVEIIRVTGTSVAGIVTGDPASINVAPFETALKAAKGDVVVTSCGFLSYWQSYLEGQIQRPFISSSLTALDQLSDHDIDALSILTFDAAKLGVAHLGNNARFVPSIIGLNPNAHLRAVIGGDRAKLDIDRAARETVETVGAATTNQLEILLLECTNLPPYKGALRCAFDIEIIDILTQIERVRPRTIQPDFL